MQEVCDDCVTTKTFKFKAKVPNTVCTFSFAWDLAEKTGSIKPLTYSYNAWDWQNAENVVQIPMVVLGYEKCDLGSKSCIEHIEPNINGSASLALSVATTLMLWLLF